MSRPVRLEIAQGLYHVTNRGLERRAIVRGDPDRREWLRLLGRVAGRCRWRIFAWSLLDNHFHLYLRTPEANLSCGMHDFESGYASLFNRRHKRRGPLFQDRFHAVLVENDSHSWEISRYVHLNCVRAKAADHPGRYLWSSYRNYLDPRRAPAWLDWRTVLAEFGGTESAARIAYRRFVEAGLSEPPPDPLAGAADGWILGSPAFVESCRQLAAHAFAAPPEIAEVLQAVARAFETTMEQVQTARRHDNRPREAALLLLRELRSDPLALLAGEFGGVSSSAINETVRRARQRAERESRFREVLEGVRRELSGLSGKGSGLQNSVLPGHTLQLWRIADRHN